MELRPTGCIPVVGLLVILCVPDAVEAAPITDSSIIGLSCLAGAILLVIVFSSCCYCCRKYRIQEVRKKQAILKDLQGHTNHIHDQIIEDNNKLVAKKQTYDNNQTNLTQNGVHRPNPGQKEFRNSVTSETKLSNNGGIPPINFRESSTMLTGHPGLKTQSWTSWVSQQPPSNADLRLPPVQHRRTATRNANGPRYVLSVPSRALTNQHQSEHVQQVVYRRPEQTGSQLVLETGSGSGKQYNTETGYTKRHVLPKRPPVISQKYVYNSAPSLRPEPPMQPTVQRTVQPTVQPTVLTQARRGVTSMVCSSQPISGQYSQQQQYIADQGEKRTYFSNYTPKVLQGYSQAQYTWSGVNSRGDTTHQWRESGYQDASIYHQRTQWATEEVYADEGETSIQFAQEEEGNIDMRNVHVTVEDCNHVTRHSQSHLVTDGEEVTIIDYVDAAPPLVSNDEPPVSTSTPRTPDIVLASLDDLLDSESVEGSDDFRHKRQRLPKEGSMERLPGGRHRPEALN